MSKYLQVISQANKLLNRYALFSSLDKRIFITTWEARLGLEFPGSLVFRLEETTPKGLSPGLTPIPSAYPQPCSLPCCWEPLAHAHGP